LLWAADALLDEPIYPVDPMKRERSLAEASRRHQTHACSSISSDSMESREIPNACPAPEVRKLISRSSICCEKYGASASEDLWDVPDAAHDARKSLA
jgi:hypothetical protein